MISTFWLNLLKKKKTPKKICSMILIGWTKTKKKILTNRFKTILMTVNCNLHNRKNLDRKMICLSFTKRQSSQKLMMLKITITDGVKIKLKFIHQIKKAKKNSILILIRKLKNLLKKIKRFKKKNISLTFHKNNRFKLNYKKIIVALKLIKNFMLKIKNSLMKWEI